MTDAKKQELRRRAMNLPLHPGVYIMHDQSGAIIYIGKAKALKNRVSQYFGSEKNHDEKVRQMVAHVDWFEYILTDSEFEALVLEASLIKQHTPKYNIQLKDDKGYHYIKITNEPWPRVSQAKQQINDGARYIGPYVSSWATKQSVDEACKIFRLPTCNRRFPRDIGKRRPCLNYYIKQCCAPCLGKISQQEYNALVEEAIDFVRGGSAQAVRKLQQRMQEASDNLQFEQAFPSRTPARWRTPSAAWRTGRRWSPILCRNRMSSRWRRGREPPVFKSSVFRPAACATAKVSRWVRSAERKAPGGNFWSGIIRFGSAFRRASRWMGRPRASRFWSSG